MTNNEINKIGLRPKLSERLPKSGPKQNCIKAYDVANNPPQTAAALTCTFPNSFKSAGMTGPISPMHIESIITAIIKKVFALLIFIKCKLQKLDF